MGADALEPPYWVEESVCDRLKQVGGSKSFDPLAQCFAESVIFVFQSQDLSFKLADPAPQVGGLPKLFICGATHKTDEGLCHNMPPDVE